jgi:hypothetical protein
LLKWNKLGNIILFDGESMKKEELNSMDKVNPAEKKYLSAIAQHESLATENPILDGASLVFKIMHKQRVAEFVVEIRMPGYERIFGDTLKEGLIWAYLQNIGDEPISVRAPEFILTGGLQLPWKVGITPIVNFFRNETGEGQSWQLPFVDIYKNFQVITTDIRKILDKCRTIVAM